MIHNQIKDITSETPEKGVKKYELISKLDTASKTVSVNIFVIESGFSANLDFSRSDTMCYVLEGKGLCKIKQLRAYWEYILSNDVAMWIPPMSPLIIKNTGDNPMRSIFFSTEISSEENISDTLEQYMISSVNRWECPKEKFVYHYQHTLFSPRKEAKKLYFGAYHTIYPKGFLPRHVENLNCEETMYVTRGKGKITSGDNKYEVNPGSIVYVPSRTYHSLENYSSDDYMEIVLYESYP